MNNWNIVYDKWVPEEQPLREALCTLGNGYFATRGAAEESTAGGIHYPGTYLAGGYNRLKSEISGQVIENEDLVNWPNWLPLTFRHEDGDWFSLSNANLIHFRQVLDMKDGILLRQLRFRDSTGRETSLTSRRLVSMAQPNLAAMQWELIPENWSGTIEIASAIDGNVTNSGVARYSALSNQHLNILETGQEANCDYIYLIAETNQSKLRMGLAARTRLYTELPAEHPECLFVHDQNKIAHHLRLNCERQQPVRIEKIVSIYTSRDTAVSEPGLEACTSVSRAPTFSELADEHRRAWRQLWQRCDLLVASNGRTQEILRLHIFHLLQTVSAHTADLDVGVPARGWHGEAYRGHIFWDELFIFPFLNLRLPEITRELLMYRYRRLPEARFAARAAGYRGAMFPWQSGSNGREESQVIHLNPKSGNWLPDDTFLQRHINAAVAYNVWQYYQATEDIEFLTHFGAELIFDIALFWSSIATWNEKKQRFEICHVVGPDEYHTQYPDRAEGQVGLNNNAYTNVMAVWVLHCALHLIDVLDDSRLAELFEQLRISEGELERWRALSSSMFVPFIDEEKKIIAQFEGYENLEELDWDLYRSQYGENMRLDRILESEGKDINRYKASKQADVLMLFYLFSSEKLVELFNMLRYDFKPEYLPANIEYYQGRTSHGSTLSKIVHSWVLARSDRKGSWQNFHLALLSDVEDIQGGTTPEGIHLGAMSGTVDLVQRCFTGLVIREQVLWLNPVLPDEIYYMESQLRYRGHWLTLRLTQQKLNISVDRGWSNSLRINVRGKTYTLGNGDKLELDLNN